MFEDRYTFGTHLVARFGDVREGVAEALRAEGFGVLTEIDVAATMKAKLGMDREPYLIIGACNPPMAQRAIAMDPAIGALLPCNVVVRADGEAVVVEVMDPRAVLGLVHDARIDEVATEVHARLARVVDAVADRYAIPESAT